MKSRDYIDTYLNRSRGKWGTREVACTRTKTVYYNITKRRADRICKHYGIKLARYKMNPKHKGSYFSVSYSRRTRKLTITRKSFKTIAVFYNKIF